MRIPREGESEVIGHYAGQEVHFVNNGDAKPSLELRKAPSIRSKLTLPPFIKRLLGPWWLGGEKPEPETTCHIERIRRGGFVPLSEVFGPEATKNANLTYLARKADALKDQIAEAKRMKRRRVHLYRALEAVTAERLRVENS